MLKHDHAFCKGRHRLRHPVPEQCQAQLPNHNHLIRANTNITLRLRKTLSADPLAKAIHHTLHNNKHTDTEHHTHDRHEREKGKKRPEETTASERGKDTKASS